MKFAISSHKDYFEKTKDNLLSSLKKSGIEEKNIYFFVGGMEKYKKISSSPNVYYVPHNSLDFTGLISVVELELYNHWWFLLHDTCFVGTNFYKKILSFNHDSHRCVRLSGKHQSMNMGAYSWELLSKRKNEILNLKNNSDTIDNFKKFLIKNEDILFHDERFIYYDGSERKISEPIDFYNTGNLRKIFYYPEIDLYKMQANWVIKQDEDYMIQL